MSFSANECSLVLNGYGLEGVQSFDGNYSIAQKPINIAGAGCAGSLISSPMQGNFLINRKLISSDPLFDFALQNTEIDGAVLFDNKSNWFGFSGARISKYSISCSVGEIPDIQVDLSVFGDIGKNVFYQEVNKDNPPIKFPDQSSIKITVGRFVGDAVTDFSYTRSANLIPVYAINKGDITDWQSPENRTSNISPVQVDVQTPVDVDINFTLIVSQYEVAQISQVIQSLSAEDIKIEVCDSVDGSVLNTYFLENAKLVGESINGSVEEEMRVSLTYKGYEN